MKNACIFICNGVGGKLPTGVSSVWDAFRSGGYTFDEMRTLFQADENKLRRVVSELKQEYDNLLLLTERNRLLAVKNAVSGIFKEETFQGGANGAGIFVDEKKSLFLLCADGSEWGAGYAKNVCVPFLQKKYGVRLDKIVVRTVGANETRIERLIGQARGLDGGKMLYFHSRSFDEDVIEILYGENVSKMLADDVLRIFVEGLGDSVYALDDTPLAEQLVTLLKLRGRKISVAESFTGGGIAKRITSVSGASAVYFEGLNTYNELSKMKRLGVSEYTLGTVGAVSDQAAYEMATGLINTGDCDISIATTGLAGPNTDRSMLPVGLCYIAVGVKERVFVYRYKFDGTREEITEKAINYALFLAYKQLKNM